MKVNNSLEHLSMKELNELWKDLRNEFLSLKDKHKFEGEEVKLWLDRINEVHLVLESKLQCQIEMVKREAKELGELHHHIFK